MDASKFGKSSIALGSVSYRCRARCRCFEEYERDDILTRGRLMMIVARIASLRRLTDSTADYSRLTDGRKDEMCVPFSGCAEGAWRRADRGPWAGP